MIRAQSSTCLQSVLKYPLLNDLGKQLPLQHVFIAFLLTGPSQGISLCATVSM